MNVRNMNIIGTGFLLLIPAGFVLKHFFDDAVLMVAVMAGSAVCIVNLTILREYLNGARGQLLCLYLSLLVMIPALLIAPPSESRLNYFATVVVMTAYATLCILLGAKTVAPKKTIQKKNRVPGWQVADLPGCQCWLSARAGCDKWFRAVCSGGSAAPGSGL